MREVLYTIFIPSTSDAMLAGRPGDPPATRQSFENAHDMDDEFPKKVNGL